ncbi:MAG: hypothetical protein ACLTR6_05125 [Clostridium fessum]
MFLSRSTGTETRRILHERSERLERTAGGGFFRLDTSKTGSSVFKTGRNPSDRTVWRLTEAQIQTLGDLLCRFEVSVNGTNSFEQAQICCGGVDVREVDAQTMESKKVKGLYFAEEFWMSMASAAVIISSGRGATAQQLEKCAEESDK